MIPFRLAGLACAAALALAAPASAAPDFKDHYAQNGAVKIHYVTAGPADKPLVVMIHGFPDFWYSWRHLMDELDGEYRVAALDTRGYNLSDKPEGLDAYKMPNLVADVEAVIKAEGRTSAIVVGHDWGAAIAWNTVFDKPQIVDRLIIMSVPHPANMAREMATNKVQQESGAYARRFQQPGSEANLNAKGLAGWVKDPAAKAKYEEAFARSSFSAMMNYYRANYPSDVGAAVVVPQTPRIKVPVLVIHGMQDTALRSPGHNGTWDHVDADTTVMMIPSATHWIEQDAGPLANKTIHDWLNARPLTLADQK